MLWSSGSLTCGPLRAAPSPTQVSGNPEHPSKKRPSQLRSSGRPEPSSFRPETGLGVSVTGHSGSPRTGPRLGESRVGGCRHRQVVPRSRFRGRLAPAERAAQGTRGRRMTERIAIGGGPVTGKSTLADQLRAASLHTEDLLAENLVASMSTFAERWRVQLRRVDSPPRKLCLAVWPLELNPEHDSAPSSVDQTTSLHPDSRQLATSHAP